MQISIISWSPFPLVKAIDSDRVSQLGDARDRDNRRDLLLRGLKVRELPDRQLVGRLANITD